MERQESKAKAHRNQRPGIAKKLASEASGKLQPKCSGPFVVIEKKNQDPFAWLTMKAGCWSTPGTPTTIDVSIFS
jgi:hypothetical protein